MFHLRLSKFKKNGVNNDFIYIMMIVESIRKNDLSFDGRIKFEFNLNDNFIKQLVQYGEQKQWLLANAPYINSIYRLWHNKSIKTFAQIFDKFTFQTFTMDNPIVNKYVTQINEMLFYSFGCNLVYKNNDNTYWTLNGFKIWYDGQRWNNQGDFYYFPKYALCFKNKWYSYQDYLQPSYTVDIYQTMRAKNITEVDFDVKPSIDAPITINPTEWIQ